MKFWIITLVCLCSPLIATAQTQEEQTLQISHEVIKTLHGFETLSDLSPKTHQQVRQIAQKLAADWPVSDAEFQEVFAAAKKEDQQQSALLGTMTKSVAIGVIICLILFIIAVIGRKVDEEKDKKGSLIVNERLQSAPYVLFIPMQEADAKRVGRHLVDKRLAARADIFSSQSLRQDINEDTVLVVSTVKGRLKKLTHRLENLSAPPARLSFSVFSGHESYLAWIADAADGRA